MNTPFEICNCTYCSSPIHGMQYGYVPRTIYVKHGIKIVFDKTCNNCIARILNGTDEKRKAKLLECRSDKTRSIRVGHFNIRGGQA